MKIEGCRKRRVFRDFDKLTEILEEEFLNFPVRSGKESENIFD